MADQILQYIGQYLESWLAILNINTQRVTKPFFGIALSAAAGGEIGVEAGTEGLARARREHALEKVRP